MLTCPELTHPRNRCASWNIEGFVCEMYAAAGQFAIGVGRTYDEAGAFCHDYYGGTLASIHTQNDYDKLADRPPPPGAVKRSQCLPP